MNSMLNNGLKAVSCAAAAAVITLAVSLSFVQSTAVVRSSTPTVTPWVAKATVQPGAWFGQTEPAVLVD